MNEDQRSEGPPPVELGELLRQVRAPHPRTLILVIEHADPVSLKGANDCLNVVPVFSREGHSHVVVVVGRFLIQTYPPAGWLRCKQSIADVTSPRLFHKHGSESALARATLPLPLRCARLLLSRARLSRRCSLLTQAAAVRQAPQLPGSPAPHRHELQPQ